MNHDRISAVRTVGVPVRDQDQALEFYTAILGLDKRMDVSLGNGGRWIEVAPAGAGTSIALVAAKPGAPAAVETGIRLSTADAGELHAYLVQNAVDADEMLRWPGVPPMFAFRDQDGNGLVIVQQA
jgi:lactoylglutathione lyase